MFCSKCGNQIDDEAIVCPKCGCATGNMQGTNGANGSTGNKILDLCIPEVKKQLKSPASAVFCSSEELEITQKSDGSFSVVGYVSSQNSYGAMIKNDFRCEMIEENNGSYKITACVVGERAAAQAAGEFAGNYIISLIITAIGGGILYFIIKMISGI